MSKSKLFLDEIRERVLVGDGAMGTELFARGVTPEEGLERMNLLAPDMVTRLHRDYVAAGSCVIETNTFGANLPHLASYGVESQEEVRRIIIAGASLARAAATGDVYVAGSIGPLPSVEGVPLEPADQAALFAAQVSALLEGEVDLLVFESFTVLSELADAAAVARSMTDIPIITQVALGSECRTADGAGADEVVARCLGAGADVIGANCGYGVPSVVSAIKGFAPHGVPMSAYLNAGFPERVEGRLLYLASPNYLVSRALDLVRLGVRLVGGCCGVGPEVIRSIAQSVAGVEARHAPAQAPRIRIHEHPTRIEPPATCPGAGYPVLVELDPPKDLDIAPLIAAARALQGTGATAITVADNPLASVRVDTLATAGMIQREAEVPVVPHLTGRDRNRLAIQSSIMGAHVLGIRSLLCVTGDPVRMCQEPNTSGVFDLTSVGLVKMVADFNAGARCARGGRTEFSIGVGLNPNVRTMSGQIDKLRRKVDAGAHFALTQPVFEEERLDLIQQAIEEAGIRIRVYLGVLPLTSARNAEFLHNEVPGILVPDEVRQRISRFEAAADQRAVGLEIAEELVHRLAPRVQGLYIICPRNRVESVLPLLSAARAITGNGR